jgi:serine/threonine-protein kinase
VILGTPAYISPEQIRGEKLTPASDIYSLGIVLYEVLVGHPPFLGSSSGKILVMHINNRPPDPLESGVEVPRRLAAIMDRALAKDPAERFQSAKEMLDELALVGGESAGIGDVQTGSSTQSKTRTIGIRTGSGTTDIRSPTRDLKEG